MVGFGDAIRMFYSRYTDFQGRSSRSEYWWMQLAILLVALVAGALIGLTGGFSGGGMSTIGTIFAAILGLAFLAHIVGLLALSVRRFHDLNQTGWLVLIFAVLGMIPLVGMLASIGQLVWFAMPGTKGTNKYGDDPYGNTSDVFS